MTAIKLAQQHIFQRHRCGTVLRITPWARAREARVLRDYDLFDEQGMLLGTIAAARTGPRLGKNAPTLYLRREVGVFAVQGNGQGATLASDWL